MKYLMLLVFISSGVYGACQAPGQSFLEGKLKESFMTRSGEEELKDVVLHPKNYALREEIKSLKRRTIYANRLERTYISADINKRFSQMIAATGREEVIAEFPGPGSTGKLSSTDDSMAIELNNLSKEELDVLPPKVLDKLENKVKIEYKYPYDKFEYVLTYDGRELPMEKAFNKIQDDFEDACEERLRENQHARDLWEQDRKTRGFSPLKPQGQGQGGSSSQ